MLNPYLYMIKIKLLLAFNYRAEVWFGLFSKVVLLFASVFFWKAAYMNIDMVASVDEQQMIVYSILSICLSALFTVSVEGNIRSRVRMGNVAIDFIKPIKVFWMYFSEDVGNCITSFAQTVVPILILSAIFIVPPMPASFLYLLLFLLSSVFSFIILWFMSALFGLLYFWLIDLGPLGSIKDYIIMILSGSFVPVWLFPEPIRIVLNFLPFIYTYQHPLSIYIGKISYTEAIFGIGVQLFWVIIFMGIFYVLKQRVEKNIMVQGG